jgi:hypothetical protein
MVEEARNRRVGVVKVKKGGKKGKKKEGSQAH